MVESAKIWLTFLNYGPYHIARYYACRERLKTKIIPVSVAKFQGEYAWQSCSFQELKFIETKEQLESVPGRTWYSKIKQQLRHEVPEVVFVAGYSHPAMISLILICRELRIPWVLMSDSRERDAKRNRSTEWIKKRIVKSANAAFVAGQEHVAYAQKLGFKEEKIFQGYDVVDNDYFYQNSVKNKIESVNKSGGYFLACNRFVPKKNIETLVNAYHQYSQLANRCQVQDTKMFRSLVLVGDGELKVAIANQCRRLGLRTYHCAPWDSHDLHEMREPCVFLPGFCQISDLPKYYANASVFVHSSVVDQWGLVVNEAMACGLPVIVSKGCGCAKDLVSDGKNGWTFEPKNVAELTSKLCLVSKMAPHKLLEMGERSKEIIANWGLARFAGGIQQCIDVALKTSVQESHILERAFLRTLLHR